jgi:hypothetical protein
VIRCALSLLAGLTAGGLLLSILLLCVLLLCILLPSFIASAKPSGQTTHSRASRGTLARIAGDSSTHRSKRCATSAAPEDMPLGRLVGIGRVCIWYGGRGHGCLSRRSAWIESGLLDGPGMTLIPIPVLLSLTLPFGRVDIDIITLRQGGACEEGNRNHDQKWEPGDRSPWSRPLGMLIFHKSLSSIVQHPAIQNDTANVPKAPSFPILADSCH